MFSHIGSRKAESIGKAIMDTSLRRQNCRCSFQPELGDCHLTHLELLSLAGHRHRKGIDKSPVARDLVVGDLTVAVTAEFIASGRLTLLQDYPGHNLLAVFFIRDS